MRTKQEMIEHFQALTGSKARTIPGLRRAVVTYLHFQYYHCRPVYERGRKTIHTEQWYRQMQRDIKAQRICDAMGLISRNEASEERYYEVELSEDAQRYIRVEAGQYGKPYPVVVTGADYEPHLEGHGFSFRWLGKWKTAPGSYTASTLRIEVGIDWIITKMMDVRSTSKGGGKCIYCADQVEYARPHVQAWPGYVQDNPVWLIQRGKTWYHAEWKNTAAEAYNEMRRSMARRRRELRKEKQEMTTIYPHVWVAPQDSYDAGNCKAMTDVYLDTLQKKIGGEIGAIRADVLLRLRDDIFTRRAVGQAMKRYA